SAAPGGATSATGATARAGGPPTAKAVESVPSERHQSPAPVAVSAPANGLEERLRTRSSPLVRKIAAEHGIEIARMQGSGIAGRVTKRDIEEYIASGASAPATRPSVHAPAGAEQFGPAPEPWAGDRVEPMSKIRTLT